jgi:hypothetical protein
MPPKTTKAPTSPVAASLLRAEALEHDLDARILQAEQRLIAREENLRRGAAFLGERVRHFWQPRRLMKPVLLAGGVAIAMAMVWLWRAKPKAPEIATPSKAPTARAKAQAPKRWLGPLGLIWLLIPMAWRQALPSLLFHWALRVGRSWVESRWRRSAPAGRAAAARGAVRAPGFGADVGGAADSAP